MTFTHDFEIGVNTGVIGIMTNLQALTTPVRYPKTAYHQFAGVIDLDDNTQRGVGLPTVTWHWTTISQEERDQLRFYCPGASENVFIRTRTNDNSAEFLYYSAVMVWPSIAEEYDAKTRQGFDIIFRMLIINSGPPN